MATFYPAPASAGSEEETDETINPLLLVGA